jgi:hypothetical protein
MGRGRAAPWAVGDSSRGDKDTHSMTDSRRATKCDVYAWDGRGAQP